MPALNVSFTEEEMAVIRAAAGRENVSLKDFVHDAALIAAENRKSLVAQAAAQVAERSAELNARLA